MAQVLSQLPKVEDVNVLVGNNTADDAAVYKINDDLAIVQTVDYFTPVVDDPYCFGQITAANSLSDVYAMGAKPLFALNMVGFPSDTLPLEVLAKILQGGADKAAEAGVSIIGGHTIKDKEPKYGLSVTGIVHPQQVVANSGAKVGDRLFLTKPLGIGIITTGIKKKGLVSEATIAEAIRVMSTLNKAAAEAMIATGVNACTDITGFGFLGHLSELVKASGVGVRISVGKVPVIAEAWDLVRQGVAPGGTHRNLAYLESQLVLSGKITKEQLLVLADAQTSGGLLISVPVVKAELLVQALHKAGVTIVAEVGEIIADSEHKIWLEP